MNVLIIRAARKSLRREVSAWQRGAVGLLILSVAVHTALTARITQLEAQHQEDGTRLQWAEQTRDSALRELGRLSNQIAQEKQERAAQAAAYEAIGAYQYIGECTVTYYCPCEECCGSWADGVTATGIPIEPGMVAVDKSIIPLGRTVVIDGQKYLAADTGVTGRHVDVFMEDHRQALERGVGTAEVWVVVP